MPTSTSMSSNPLSSPYINYARIKTPSGTETVVPVCRDPHCINCQINTHAAQIISGTCPPACSQCAQLAAHTKSLASLPSALIPSIPPTSL